MTERQKILDHYEAALKTLDLSNDLKTVKVNKVDSRDIVETKLPAAWVFSGSERRADPKYGKNMWNWEIHVQVWDRNADMEELLGKVHGALHARWQAEEFCEVWYRKSAELWIVDSDGETQGWSLIYTNFYLTDKGQV